MLKINFTVRMREFLHRQMIMTDFELELHLKRRRRELQAQIATVRAELAKVEQEITELEMAIEADSGPRP